ncbi:MAG TPA: ceramidase domain-containing protein [Spirosoma sp.]|nr:ceramidase domain-containing protein [Spirosoma sp.]
MPAPTLKKLMLLAALITLGMLALWLILDATLTASVWSPMKVSQSAIMVEYCEYNHPQRFFHQPVNTYSNLVYFFCGILILLIARYDSFSGSTTPFNRLAGFPLLSSLMGGCFVYLGFGSAFFHASLTYVGQRVDMNATYSILLTLVGITVYHLADRIRLNRRQQGLWVFSLLAVIGGFIPLALRIPSSLLVPALILLLNAGMLIHYFQFRKQRSIGVILLSLVLVVLALYIRTLDVRKIGCDPYSYFQGHALWHLLTAVSSFCSYCFFRFEKTGRFALST